MEWMPEKFCSERGDYDLSIERMKNGYHCKQSSDSWKWRVIKSGVVVSQGLANDMALAQAQAEANLPAG